MKNQPSILVIDDEPIICNSCHRILSKENYLIDTNIDPQRGLHQALSNHYDVILLDLKMDKMDGMKLLSEFRQKKPDTPVIIITGYPSRKTKEESNKLNVTNYILKPFLPQELLKSVNNILEQPVTPQKRTSGNEQQIIKKPKIENSNKNYPFFKPGVPESYGFRMIGGLWRGC